MQSDPRFAGYNSYIMSAYVDFMMSAGARVVPIIISDSDDVVLDKISKLDGVLFPGGDGDNLELGNLVWDTIMQINEDG